MVSEADSAIKDDVAPAIGFTRNAADFTFIQLLHLNLLRNDQLGEESLVDSFKNREPLQVACEEFVSLSFRSRFYLL